MCLDSSVPLNSLTAPLTKAPLSLKVLCTNFPVVRAVPFEDESVVIEATAYDTGVIMWLLSQGKNVQVLSPPSFVEKIKQEIGTMQKRYTT